MTNNQATLHKLDQMRLHGMARALRTSLDTQGQWTADELLAHLVDAESDDRHERRLKRLLKAARFRYPAAIEEVDFALRRNLDQNQLLRLADCRWVGQHQDLIITGKCGSGKSFLASALGHQACLRGFRVGYHASSRLFGELRLARRSDCPVRRWAVCAVTCRPRVRHDVRRRRSATARSPASIASRAMVPLAQSIARRLTAAASAAGIEGRITGHSGRVGLAVELTRRGAPEQATAKAGGWKSSRMVAHYAAPVAAEQGAVATYL